MKSRRLLVVLIGLALSLMGIVWIVNESDSADSANEKTAKTDHDKKDFDDKDFDSDDFARGGRSSASGSSDSWGDARAVDVTDPMYGMTAYTVGVPEGWKFSGDIVRGKACHEAGQSLEYTLQSPDGQISIQRLPEMAWSYNPNRQPPCGSLDLTSASDFLVNIVVPKLHESAKILEVLPPTPEGEQAIEAELQHDQEKQSAMAQAIGMPSSRALVDGARVHIAYDEGGQQFEEVILAVVHCAQTPDGGRSCQTGGGETVVRAPAGKLNTLMSDSSFQQMAADVHDNSEWQDKLTEVAQQKFVQQLQTMRANAQVIARVSDESFRQRLKASDQAFQGMMANSRAFNARQEQRFQTSQSNARAQEDSLDRSARQTENFALDQQQYTNPYNGQIITASNQFNRVWASSDGSILAGTTGNENPNDYTAPGAPTLTQANPYH
jgi:hypothetical protein